MDIHREAGALIALIDGQQVAALDFSVDGLRVTINMVFVKPPFRHQGVARALLERLRCDYPQVDIRRRSD